MKVITLVYVVSDEQETRDFPELLHAEDPEEVVRRIREGYTVLDGVQSCLGKNELAGVTVVDDHGDYNF